MENTLSALDFIALLIQHIPEKHFKTTRYYGLYARYRASDKALFKAIPAFKHKILLDFNPSRSLFLLSFGYDPLQCPKCMHKMEFLELYYNHQRVSLEELYEKAMSKSRGKRSSA